MKPCYELIIQSNLVHVPVINTSLTIGSIGVYVINFLFMVKPRRESKVTDHGYRPRLQTTVIDHGIDHG